MLGWFESQIVPVEAPQLDGSTTLFSVDEHPRRGVTAESLGDLKPLHPEIEGFTVTAGNAAGLNDAAAAVVLTSRLRAAHGVTPWPGSRGQRPGSAPAAPAWAPRRHPEGPGPGRSPSATSTCGRSTRRSARCRRRPPHLGIDPTIINVNGSGCSLGHPIAATGARMVVTMVHELQRRGLQTGVVSMCAGGGMGSALVLELV